MAGTDTPPGPNRQRRETTYDVRIWSVRRFAGKKGSTYRVRWRVAGNETGRSFPTRALADRFRSDLVAATNRGELFDVETALPLSMIPDTSDATWWEWALEFVDLKWPDLAPNSRLSLAEAMTTATIALATPGWGQPDAAELRRAMMQWAFITPRRAAGDPPEHLTRAVHWLANHTVKLTALEDTVLARAVLDALSRRLDGGRAAATTIARKRAVFHNALALAVERGLLAANPLPKLQWKPPKTAQAIDPACVVNPEQARALLDAVAQVGSAPTAAGAGDTASDGDRPAAAKVGRRLPSGGPLAAFFGCIYYAGTRPSEALAITRADLTLPEQPDEWGMLRLSQNDPEVTSAWTDTGKREARPLKHRARGEVRYAPIAPQLAELLRRHLDTYGVGAGGRLFVGPRGAAIKESVYTDIWQAARRLVLGADADRSPLARRPYDLRHSCVSTWLAAGVDSAQIATWVGHSVAVLHRVYAHVLPGRDEVARRRIAAILGSDEIRPSPASSSGTKDG